MAPSSAPIPITIVTGFLGSGKTTLILNLVPQLKKANPGYKLALLKNEFGDLAVDSQLASSGAVSGVQELLNGCICCNLVGQLGDALAELQKSVRPDRIVIETSGSAFPATLALEVNRLARETGGRYALDGVVSVVDVENWKGYEDTSYTARLQARYTDLVVFNKWEACDERRFDECLDRLGDLEVDVAWTKSSKGWVPVDLVFGIDGGLLARALLLEEDGAAVPAVNGHDHAHGDDGDGHDYHQSEVEVLSVSLTSSANGSTAAVNPDKLLSLLKSAPKDEVYRIKAVLTAAAPTTTPSALQGSDAEAAADSAAGASGPGRYILNWAFGRWTYTAVADGQSEHESSDRMPLRMTLILARHESTKWKKKLETGGFFELDGGTEGKLTVTRIA
ncbi:CobW domain-containing protein [Magnaporthiopsis poae ATCC 64411]|uniref:CobW domain-containing protein n=1 Tax=Magnaporthiopsis poae (strain ATCC 64411 / 73-15) TaxID=644358 RepID=A0A0C4DVH5_MAGP6|nr:CobW domain-containing protein [Magnaporthiopsis poae ATCC 64411]